MRRLGIILIVLALVGVLGLFSCSTLKLTKPESPELAALAESVAETIIVFLPVEHHAELAQWKPQVEKMKVDLESGEPLTAYWVRDRVADILATALLNVVSDDDTGLTEAQRNVLIKDFNRSIGLIHFETDVELTADQKTILYGAVNGILQGMTALGI